MKTNNRDGPIHITSPIYIAWPDFCDMFLYVKK